MRLDENFENTNEIEIRQLCDDLVNRGPVDLCLRHRTSRPSTSRPFPMDARMGRRIQPAQWIARRRFEVDLRDRRKWLGQRRTGVLHEPPAECVPTRWQPGDQSTAGEIYRRRWRNPEHHIG